MIDQTTIATLGRELYDAERSRATLDPLTDRHPEIELADAYAIQSEYIRLRKELDGTENSGVKVGATSKAIQAYFGIDQPDFGVLLADMEIRDGGVLTLDECIQPRIEPELAFVLNRDLAGPGLDWRDVLAVTESIAPCIEVIDSRIHDWRIRLGDTVADNGSSSRYILGPASAPDVAGDLASVEVWFQRNDVEPLVANGSAVYGHPAASVAWLANTLGALGGVVRAGQVILSGSLTTAVECCPGDTFVADFTGFGAVRFTTA